MDQSTEGSGPSVPPRWASARNVAVPDGVAADATVPDPGAPGAAPAPEVGPVADDGHDPIAHGSRSRPASLARSARDLLLGGALLMAVSVSRRFPDWDEGRWWLLPVIGLPLAALAGFVALLLAVSGTGEARRRSHMSGAPFGVALVLAATLLLAGVGLRAVDDWHDIDVPAAWDRLRDSGEADDEGSADPTDVDIDEATDGDPAAEGYAGIIDSAEDVTAGERGTFRMTARIGECRVGDAADVGDGVDCSEPHRLEVTGQVDLTDTAPDELDLGGRVAAATAACDAAPDIGPPPAGGVTQVLVPSDVEWGAGLRDGLCLAVWETAVEGRQT